MKGNSKSSVLLIDIQMGTSSLENTWALSTKKGPMHKIQHSAPKYQLT